MTIDASCEALCRELYPPLVRLLSLHCGNPHVAEELAQEALTKFCVRWSQAGDLDSPRAWTYRVAMNLANSWFRRAAAERRALARSHHAVTESVAGPDPSLVAVREALQQLPPRQRTVLLLRFYADLPVPAVAQAMDCAEGTVKAQTHKALKRLRLLLGELTEEAADA